MVSQLIVGVNTWRTRDEANAYLEDSIRAGQWKTTPGKDRDRALISAFRLLEKQLWAGERTGARIVATAAISAGGTGYVIGDVLSVSGGTFGEPARIEVTSVAAGVIDGIQLIDAGTYDAGDEPTSPVATTGGGNNDATFNLTFQDQLADFPREPLTCNGSVLDPLEIPVQLGDAQIELAFEMVLDPGLETAANTGSNVKRAKAGSAEVEFFRASNRPGESTRFPPVVDELLRCLKGGGVTPGYASGATSESQFDDCDRMDLTEGYA